MGSLPEQIDKIVLRRANRDDMGKFAIDSQMLAVWMELDGKKTLGAVAEKLGLSLPAIRHAVSELLRLRLIDSSRRAVAVLLDKDFIDCLCQEFSLAVGPIARVLIEEEAVDMGHPISRFPANRIAELINALAREIQREEKSTVFKQKMISKIREKGY